MLFVKHNDKTLAVADFIDEAQEFAERLEEPNGVVNWSPTGEMYVNGGKTGWKIRSVLSQLVTEERPL